MSSFLRLKNTIYWISFIVVFSVAVFVTQANVRLPYGDHMVIALNLVDHSFPYYSPISRGLLSMKEKQYCGVTGTIDGHMVSVENGTLQFLMAAWERERSDGWGRNVDRDLLRELLDKAILACNPNSYSPEIGPFSPLIYAILMRDVALLRQLLERGADPMMVMESPGNIVDGMNAIEYAQLIQNKQRFDGDLEVMGIMIDMMSRTLTAP